MPRTRGVPHQRDTYFHAVSGRLKLREAPPQPAERDRVEQLRTALGIGDEQLIAQGYADLLA